MSWPDDLRPSTMDWWLETHTMTHTSPLSRATQTLELPGARWRVSLSFNNLLRAEMERLSSFINGLRGPAGRLTLWPMQQQSILEGTTELLVFGRRKVPYIGYPYINFTLDAQALPSPAGSTVIPLVSPKQTALPAGYFFSVVGELKQVVRSNIRHDRVWTTITPPMRKAISASGNPIPAHVDFRPSAIFRLADDSQGRASYRGGGQVGSMTIDLVEVF